MTFTCYSVVICGQLLCAMQIMLQPNKCKKLEIIRRALRGEVQIGWHTCIYVLWFEFIGTFMLFSTCKSGICNEIIEDYYISLRRRKSQYQLGYGPLALI